MSSKKYVNQLRSGVLLSYINLFLGSLIPFFYTPVMLRILGSEEYGLFSLSNSATGYLSLLSFGLGATLIRYVAKYRAEKNKEAIERIFGFFLMLFFALALLVLLGGAIISNNVEPIFHRGLKPREIEKVSVLIYIMTVNTALSFPLSVFTSVIIAHERYVFRRIVDIIITVASPLCNLFALYLGYASIGMAISSTVIQFAVFPINIWYCFKVLNIYPHFKILDRKLIHELLCFSVFSFMGTLVDMLFWSTDKVILGMLASSTSVAIYNIGGTFNNITMNFSTSISGVLTPKITGMVVSDTSSEKLSELFIRVGRIQYFVIALIATGFTVFGRNFFIMWAGIEYERSYWITVLTLFPLCIPLIQNTGVSIVVAQNKHKFRSIVYLCIAVLNVITTYLVTPYLGEIGAAVCSAVSYLIGQGIIMNIYYHKVTGINIPLFWKNIAQMSIIPFVMMCIGLAFQKVLYCHNWGKFFAFVLLYTVIYCVAMYIVVLNDYEKNIIRNPVKKILNIIRKAHNAFLRR